MKGVGKRILITGTAIIAVGAVIVVVFGRFKTETSYYHCNICDQRWQDRTTKLWGFQVSRTGGEHEESSHPAPVNAGYSSVSWTALEGEKRIGCGSTGYGTEAITKAQYLYAQSHEGYYPDDIAAIVEEDWIDAQWLVSYGSSKSNPKRPSTGVDVWVRKHSPFILIPGLTNTNDPTRVAVFARPEEAVDGKLELGFCDMHTSLVPVDEARAMIADQTGMTIEQLIERQENYER